MSIVTRDRRNTQGGLTGILLKFAFLFLYLFRTRYVLKRGLAAFFMSSFLFFLAALSTTERSTIARVVSWNIGLNEFVNAEDVLVREETGYQVADGSMRLVFQESQNETAVLVVGYMRGGTTFLGDFLNRNKDAFYWYEPLPALFDARFSREKIRCRHLLCHMFHTNGTYRYV